MNKVLLPLMFLTGFVSADKYETANLKGTVLCPPSDTMIAFSPKAEAIFQVAAKDVSDRLVVQLLASGVMRTELECTSSKLKKVYMSFDIDGTEQNSSSKIRAYSIFAYIVDPKPTGYQGYVILWSRSSVKATVSDQKTAFDAMVNELFGYIEEFDINHKTANP